ncbi:MAG: hypothetical protein EOM91_11225 [Sphingobacteriia bacterium]|nr:hypothetical protein [Sphingobacteriia bacterium]NCC40645.1 hypothetical protein [Gammaproteobacteria bacterium]
MKHHNILLPLTASFMALSLTAGAAGVAPTIELTAVPRCGEGPNRTGTIAGNTSGAEQGTHRLVIFAGTDRWYVQPYSAAPFTAIGRDGQWRTHTHLGHQYAAVLVTTGYTPPASTFALPQVGDGVLAVEVISCEDSQ